MADEDPDASLCADHLQHHAMLGLFLAYGLTFLTSNLCIRATVPFWCDRMRLGPLLGDCKLGNLGRAPLEALPRRGQQLPSVCSFPSQVLTLQQVSNSHRVL